MKLARILASTTLAIGVLGAVSLAHAQTEGIYVGAAGGYSIPDNTDINNTAGNASAGVDLKNGGVGLVFGGYEFSSGFRAELELGHRWNRVDSVGGVNASGKYRINSMMLNGIYEFGQLGRLKPHVGFGVGGANLKVKGVSPVLGTSVDNGDTTLAFQAIAGLDYDITVRLQLSLGYRFFMVPDADVTAATGQRFDTDYRAHNVLLGLRFRFGGPKPAPEPVAQPAAAPAPQPAPPPPAPPAPPPAPRNFIVFFDWDRSDLTAEAARIVSEAAAAGQQLGAVRIDATGHADRSGPASYNVGLSQRRAEAVKAELVRLGVPENTITVDWKGETEPLVPTDDGVREPQNRRVEIVIR